MTERPEPWLSEESARRAGVVAEAYNRLNGQDGLSVASVHALIYGAVAADYLGRTTPGQFEQDRRLVGVWAAWLAEPATAFEAPVRAGEHVVRTPWIRFAHLWKWAKRQWPKDKVRRYSAAYLAVVDDFQGRPTALTVTGKARALTDALAAEDLVVSGRVSSATAELASRSAALFDAIVRHADIARRDALTAQTAQAGPPNPPTGPVAGPYFPR